MWETGGKGMRIVVCDDAPEDIERVAGLLREHYGSRAEIAAFERSRDALAYFEGGGGAELVVLDIFMPEPRGEKLAARLRALGFGGALLFLTASNDFAAESYEVAASSYLLKPVKPEAFFRALRAIDERAPEGRGFVVRSRGRARYIAFPELLYAEVRGHHLHFHLANGETEVLHASMKEFEDIFEREASMARSHRSFYINMACVETLGRSEAVLRGGATVPVSRRYASFEKRYCEWVLRRGR